MLAKITLIIILILLLAIPGQNLWKAALILPSLLQENKFRPLDYVTGKPSVSHVKIPHESESLDADLYLPSGQITKVLLVIHGANEKGKDDLRIINFGQTFARAGIAALIPTFPDITREKFTPKASSQIISAYSYLSEKFPDERSGMIAFSVAGGPMFIASANPAISAEVDYLISFGGYYELKEVLKNMTTGENRDPFGHELISSQYLKLFGPNQTVLALLNNTDPTKFDLLFDQLSPNVKQFMEDLTPLGHLKDIEAKKIFIIHGDPDYIVPVNESIKLKQALGARAKLTILKSFSHVNVQFPKATLKNIITYYIPETAKLYGVIFEILN